MRGAMRIGRPNGDCDFHFRVFPFLPQMNLNTVLPTKLKWRWQVRPTILDKTFGTLSHLHMICAFSNLPPPPQTVLGVTGQKRLRSLIKCMNFNFVQGGVGEAEGNRGITVLTTVN